MNRQVRRIQKAIDELIKIKDDGYGHSDLEIVLDKLWSLELKMDEYHKIKKRILSR
jgi:hypothetical protein